MSSYRANLETPEKMENLETKEQWSVAFFSLLCAFPFYVDAHDQSAESFAEVAGTYVKSQSAYCDCIPYLVRFQGETGKQGPVGPAGPPGIIVRHSIFNVLYCF